LYKMKNLNQIIFAVILFFTFGAHRSVAQNVVGYDLLALQHPLFPIEEVLGEIPNGSALGVLLDTFGEDRSRITQALSSGKFTSFRIHLANGPGLRNGQLGGYENLSGLTIRSFESKILNNDQTLLKTFVERAKFVNDLATRFPSIKCFLSPVLEHNLSSESFSKLAEITRQAAPSCLIVNNPVSGWKYQLAQGQFLEVHGLDKTPLSQYIASQDGYFGSKESFLNHHQAAFIKFIWRLGFNCRAEGEFIDPRARKCG
jgi:hypothetical protein